MVRVCVGNTKDRKWVIVDSNATLRSVLDDSGVDYSRGVLQLSGETLTSDALGSTFADFGITDGTCFLSSVVKADNA